MQHTVQSVRTELFIKPLSFPLKSFASFGNCFPSFQVSLFLILPCFSFLYPFRHLIIFLSNFSYLHFYGLITSVTLSDL